MTLAEEMEAFRAKSRTNPDPERKAVYARAAESLAETDILEKALGVGDEAPMFELPDSNGQVVRLEDLLEIGPVVVSFYRGAWCPFCNMELGALQREVDAIKAAGVTLVAISPNVPDESLGVIEKHGITFPVLSDHENTVARKFNLVYEMESGLVAYYRKIDRNVDQMNGSAGWELPVPATYVVDQEGVIQYAFVDLNHRVRAEPADVVAVATALAA